MRAARASAFPDRVRRTERYETDFVVETDAGTLIVEIKTRRDLDDDIVQAKANAARIWIGHANDHAKRYGGKPWRHLLVLHDWLLNNMILDGLAARRELPPLLDGQG